LTEAKPGQGNLELTITQLTRRCQLRRDGVPSVSMDNQLTSFSIVKP
jgi:hypothetical protein